MSFVSKHLKPSHKQKTLLFKSLDFLPEKLGYYCYHKIQNLYNKQSLSYKIKSTRNSFRIINRILERNKLSLKDTFCVEMGSGWLPIFPYLLVFEGKVHKVTTYDVNTHYNKKKINALNEVFIKEYTLDSSQFSEKYGLPSTVEYFPSQGIETASLSNVDFIFSRFVLEHVPPEVLDSIHKSLYENLPEDAYILHLISPSDHRAYSDKSLSLYDFLKYSIEEWDKIQTKFDYHNRLRLPQYLAIFSTYFEVVHLEFNSCEKGTPQFEKFQELKIHPDFSKFNFEELTAGSINVLLRKKKVV